MKALLTTWRSAVLTALLALTLTTQAAAQRTSRSLPDITLTTPEGKTISLSSLRGKVVLVDFWASWCGPCRAENPTLVKCHAKYRGKSCRYGNGFEIFSISLDVNKDKWAKAIKADRMTWEWQGSDLSGWKSPVAQSLGIHQIPSNFLIDKDGNIIATNLRGQDLVEFLKGVFGE